jgi:DNA-binding response OmpR family regulator
LRQQQRQFINRIGHELRTPLSLVYGYLQTTLRKSSTLTAAEREALEIATSETERTTQLLQNLLDLARTNSDVSQQIYSHLVRCRSKTVTAHILLVEDETKLARFLELELSSEGYRVSVAHDGMEGLTRARESSPDLAVLDWMLPGLTGVELCRRLRATGIKIPVILLTARDEIGDRVTGLDAGADDYVVKPFSIEELLARIRAHLRRIDEPDSDLLQFEDLSLNRRTREVLRAQRAIELTVKEFDLLEYLLSHPRQVLTRDRILEQVWGYDFVGDSNVIEVYIRYLRLKLEENNEKRLIHTVRGVGYVLRE